MIPIKLVIASLLLPIGYLFGLAVATEYINPQATCENQSSGMLGGLLFGLPALTVGTGLVWQEYTKLSQKLAAQQRRLHAIFTDILVKNQGEISVTYLMQYTQLSQAEAQHFLEKKAALLNATVKRHKNGDIYYYFDFK